MLHITREFALDIDRFMHRLAVSTGEVRQTLSPDTPQLTQEFPSGSVRLIPGRWGRATGFGMNGPVDPETLETVEALFRSNDLPSRFALNPFSDKAFAAELGRRGYNIEYWMQVLVRELSDADLISPNNSATADNAAPDSGLSIERLPADRDREWAELIAEGFKTLGHDYLMDPMFHLPMVHIPEGIGYLARWNGEPAAAACLNVIPPMACLMTSATLPQFRRHGIQSAFIRRRLSDARAEGCEVVIFLTDPGSDSQRNAERAGFHTVYNLTMLVQSND